MRESSSLDMDAQPELVQQIADEVERRFNARFDAAEERLGGRIEKGLENTGKELKHQAKLDKEDLADQIKKAAEGYSASLALLDRKLDELRSKWDTQIADHDAAIADHARRVSALERARRR